MAKTTKSSPKPSQLSQVRIIAGLYRRRLVNFVDADGLRPTPDRVRETVFNWLADHLVNARVLDCCAGSGVLGFEALSRGATQVVCAEPNRQQFLQIQRTQTSLGITDQQLVAYPTTIESVILSMTDQPPFDVIFIDPPYRINLWATIIEKLIFAKLISPATLLYIESDQPHELILASYLSQLEAIKYKKIGQIWVGLYQLSSLT